MGGPQIALSRVVIPQSTDDWLKAVAGGDPVFLTENDLLPRTKVLCLTVCRNTHSCEFILRHLREMRDRALRFPPCG